MIFFCRGYGRTNAGAGEREAGPDIREKGTFRREVIPRDASRILEYEYGSEKPFKETRARYVLVGCC